MPEYHLFNDELVQGPYSESEVNARIEAGVFTAESIVSEDGGDWLPLSDVLPHLFIASVAPIKRDPRSMKTTDLINSCQSSTTIIESVDKEAIPPSKSYEGIGRFGFFVSFVGIAFLAGLISALTQGSEISTLLAAVLLLIAASYRLKNIGRNPALCFLILIPLLGLLITLPCFLLPAGYQDHRKLDMPAKIIGGALLLLFITLSIWIFILIRFSDNIV